LGKIFDPGVEDVDDVLAWDDKHMSRCEPALAAREECNDTIVGGDHRCRFGAGHNGAKNTGSIHTGMIAARTVIPPDQPI